MTRALFSQGKSNFEMVPDLIRLPAGVKPLWLLTQLSFLGQTNTLSKNQLLFPGFIAKICFLKKITALSMLLRAAPV